jgi:hypothetical protein
LDHALLSFTVELSHKCLSMYIILCGFPYCHRNLGTLFVYSEFCHAFSSVVRQMPGYNSQRRGTARTSQFLFIALFVPFSVFCVLFVCKCVMYCCHRVSTQCVTYCCHQVSTQFQLKINKHIYIYNIMSCKVHISPFTTTQKQKQFIFLYSCFRVV